MIQTAYVSVPTVKRTNGNFVTLSVTGNGTIAGTLGVTGAVTVGSLETVGDLIVGGSTVDLGTAAVGGAGDFSWSTGEFAVSSPILTLDSPIGQLSGTWSALTTSTVNLLGASRIGQDNTKTCDLRAIMTTVNGGMILEKHVIGSSADWTLTDKTVRRIFYHPTVLIANHSLTIDISDPQQGQVITIYNTGAFDLTILVAGYGELGKLGPTSGKKMMEVLRVTGAWMWVSV